MKRKGATFGHSQVDYRLGYIFKRAVKEFQAADSIEEKTAKEYDSKKDDGSVDLLPQVFRTRELKMEAGVVLIMSAGAFLEQVINDYAYTFLDADSFEEHLGNLRAVTKWILVPRLCQNKEISEDDPAINALREFVKARNAIVHHKRKDFDLDFHSVKKKVSTESARFWLACKKVESTVDDLIKILTSPPPGVAKK